MPWKGDLQDQWTGKTPTHSQNASELIELFDIPDDTTVLQRKGVVACPEPDIV